MQRRSLGTTSIQITPILMGTWQAGRRWWVGIDDQEIIKALQVAVAAGVNTIDTAEIYGDGYSERIIATALKKQRHQLVYATKVFANHLRYAQVLAACERSLQNLETDYIDLYQIHWPSGSFNTEPVPIEETMAALVELQQQGKIRAIGVSNFSLEQLIEASQYGPIESIQPPFSLVWPHVGQALQPYCVERQISILAYSPLAQGLLTGKFGPDQVFPAEDNRAKNKLFQGTCYQTALKAVDQLRPLAHRHGITLAQLALAWVIAQPQTHAIAGARNPQQARQNAQAATVTLSPEELATMARIAQPVLAHFGQEPVMWNWD